MCMMVRDKTKKDAYMCATLLNMFQRGELRKNHPQQRKADKWKTDARDGFVATVLKHEDVDSIKICEQIINKKVYLWLIDGLQRLTVLERFKKGTFKIGKNIEFPIIFYQKSVTTQDGEAVFDEYGVRVTEDVEYDLRGKGYNDLPEELKEKFDNFTIDVVKHLDCTDEEIGYHIRRYNRQSSMNNNETSVTYMDAIAKEVKDISQEHDFFKNCGKFTPSEKQNGTCERVVCESLMAMFHLEDWQKNAKKMGAYLNSHTSGEEFDIFKEELTRLEVIVGDDFKDLFTSKDSFLFFTLFHKFVALGVDDKYFVEFLTNFENDLHSRNVEDCDNLSFDDINANRATKDKSVVQRKINILMSLMEDFLHIDEEKNLVTNDIESFVSICVGIDKEEVHADMDCYNQSLDDLLNATVRIESKLRHDQNRPSLLAMVVYSFKNEVDLDDWLIEYATKNNTYFIDQKKNYLHMLQDYERYQKKGNAA